MFYMKNGVRFICYFYMESLIVYFCFIICKIHLEYKGKPHFAQFKIDVFKDPIMWSF